MDDEKYLEELKDNGVDLPELENPDPEDSEPEPAKEPEPKDEEPEEEGDEDGEGDDGEGEKPAKRSIYKTLKDKKTKLRDTTTKLTEAEQKIQEKDQRISELEEQLKNAVTPEEKADAQDELDAFAEEVGLDPEGVKKLKSLILKDAPTISEEDRNAIEDAKKLSQKDAEKEEKERFATEFKEFTPELQKFFPNLSDADVEVIRKEVDKLAHSAGYNDKELDYIVFKNKDALAKLISPKKRGLESKNQETVSVNGTSKEFNPNPDFSKMTSKEIDQWEADYAAMSNTGDGLATDSNGRKIII